MYSNRCEYNGNILKRDLTKENVLASYIEQGKNKIKELINGSVQRTKTKSKKENFYEDYYNPFLLQTTQKMVEMTTTHKLLLPPSSIEEGSQTPSQISFELIDDKITEFVRMNDNTKVINIIAFGKSLQYLLKYIAFHLRALKQDDSIVVMVFCDNESFLEYQDNIQNFSITREPEYEIKRLFTDQINGDYRDNALLVFHKEYDILQRIPIYFVESTHYLMKGIGGKRGVIQYYNKEFLSNNNEAYKCMTIDDNITGIVKYKTKKQQKQDKQCSLTDARENIIPNYCEIASILDVYDYLSNRMEDYPNIFFSGIVKGDAIQDSVNQNEHIVSCIIYKLNLSKPHKLFNEKLYYNPYFTNFFEDIAFNHNLFYKNNQKCYINNNFFLRFGHTESAKYKPDFNDTFNKIEYKKIDGVVPIFLMYILFFVSLYENRLVFLKHETSKDWFLNLAFFDSCNIYEIQYASKYSAYQHIFYMYCLLYLFKKNDKFVLLCENTDINTIGTIIHSSSYPLYLLAKLIANGFIEKEMKSDTCEIIYYISKHLPLINLENDISNLNAVYNGVLDNNDNIQLIQDFVSIDDTGVFKDREANLFFNISCGKKRTRETLPVENSPNENDRGTRKKRRLQGGRRNKSITKRYTIKKRERI